MAFTRFHDDPNRIHKQLQQSTYAGMYQLNSPGTGLDLPFSQETQLRLQGWGANFDNKMISQENDLRGMTRKLNKDYIDVNNYTKYEKLPSKPTYKIQAPYVEESRASLPAWTFREVEQKRWEEPFLNPQAGLERPFQYDIQTRILEKDNYVPEIPDLSIISKETL
uniref:Uncharacterized protein n=1 Tax=viral metagenome TaxID=1070528 RepID=A0A6C0B777_9ZZZZ